MFITSCVTVAPVVNSKSEISIYGVKTLPPQNGDWIVMTASGYQVALASVASNKNESLVANVSIYQLPEFASDKEFLDYIIKRRTSEPKIGRFEIQKKQPLLHHLTGLFASGTTLYQKIKRQKLRGGIQL